MPRTSSTSRIRLLASAAIASVVAVLGIAAPAMAAAEPTLTLPERIYPEDAIEVSGEGWAAGAEIDVEVKTQGRNPIDWGTLQADASGSFVETVQLGRVSGTVSYVLTAGDGTTMRGHFWVHDPAIHALAKDGTAHVEFWAEGFEPGPDLELTGFSGGELVAGPFTVTTDDRGTIPRVRFPIPPCLSTRDDNSAIAVDPLGREYETRVWIEPGSTFLTPPCEE